VTVAFTVEFRPIDLTEALRMLHVTGGCCSSSLSKFIVKSNISGKGKPDNWVLGPPTVVRKILVARGRFAFMDCVNRTWFIRPS